MFIKTICWSEYCLRCYHRRSWKICKRTRLFLILSFGREQSCANKKITDNALSQYLLQWHQQTLLSSLSLGHRFVIVNLVMSPTCIKMYLLSLSSSQDLQIEQTSTYYFVTFYLFLCLWIGKEKSIFIGILSNYKKTLYRGVWLVPT